MKVFVTVGSGGFDALVREADKLDCEVVCQIGKGAYAPGKQQWFRVCPSLEPWYDWADVIVAHGGAGTLLETVGHGKKVIAIPNTERSDRHQEELVEELARGNVLVRCATVADLPSALSTIGQKKLAAYVPPKCGIPDVIHAFLQRLA